ncbi:MAG: porin family protein, partial [Acetobacteraceae bacterium]
AEDWTGAFLTFGVSETAIDYRSSTSGTPTEGGRQDDLSPYIAAGYDWAHGNLTFGVIADLDAAQVGEDFVSGGKGYTGESDFFATLRARVGMQVGDQTRVFASGGIAALGVASSQSGFVSGSEHQTLTGTAAGLGMEYMLSPGRHLSVEYLHADFGESDFHDGNVTREPAVDSVRVGYTLRF